MRIKGPYKLENGIIFASGDFHFADLRGWGALTGKGGGRGLSDGEAEKIMNANGQFLVDALNEKERRGPG